MVIKNKKTSFLFPKLVVSGDIENFTDIRQDLIDWIYKFKEKNSGISKISNRGGWQSESKKIFVVRDLINSQSILYHQLQNY